MAQSTDNLVKAVQAHARANYNEGGWDMIVEAYEPSEIAELIEGATTEAEAIAKVSTIVGIRDDRRQGAINAGL